MIDPKSTRAPLGSVLGLIAIVLALAVTACASPPAPPPKDAAGPKHVFKDLKDLVAEYPVPAAVAQALPGLQDDKIRLYREISPVLALVVYAQDYSRMAAVKMAARAFVALADQPDFRQGVDFWVIQVQPQSQLESPELVVWGVRPEEVDQFIKSADLAAFLKSAEYLSVDDVIIEAGDKRLEPFLELRSQPAAPNAPEAPAPAPPLTPPAAPAPGEAPPPPAPAEGATTPRPQTP